MIKTLLFLGLCTIIEKSSGEDFPRHVKYLVEYGYLEKAEEGGPPDSFTSEEIDSALKKAQEFAGIPATGKLDNQTIAMISAPRCGFPDAGSRITTGSKWNKRHITYGFVKYSPKLNPRDIEEVLSKAFQTWAVPSGLRFTRVNAKKADVKIGFFTYDHGDNDPFEGPGSALAHASLPGCSTCYVHFNDDELWIIDNYNQNNRGYLLLATATHELGHTLGLRHSNVPGSIMKSSYTGRTRLSNDDIEEIKTLYNYNR